MQNPPKINRPASRAGSVLVTLHVQGSWTSPARDRRPKPRNANSTHCESAPENASSDAPRQTAELSLGKSWCRVARSPLTGSPLKQEREHELAYARSSSVSSNACMSTTAHRPGIEQTPREQSLKVTSHRRQNYFTPEHKNDSGHQTVTPNSRRLPRSYRRASEAITVPKRYSTKERPTLEQLHAVQHSPVLLAGTITRNE